MYCADSTQYSIRLEGVRYMQQHVFPWAHPSPRRKRHLDRFSRFCRAYQLTDRLTDLQTTQLGR